MFEADLNKMNKMYSLPVADRPTISQLGVAPMQRLLSFKKILSNELDEIDMILAKLHSHLTGIPFINPTEPSHDMSLGYVPDELEVLTDLADLFGDIQVYAGSEMLKFGLPVNSVLTLIMNSNFSKLGADGKPIYDEDGKVQKGPNYWKPEPQIRTLLTALRDAKDNPATKAA